jgi:Dolichyl-phosphate-mannose-protein mannosyltransferase
MTRLRRSKLTHPIWNRLGEVNLMNKIYREWPLAIVLAAQAALTVPWLWRTAPFTDEALYLDAGHQMWAHWLHDVPIPDYASSFSGAPVLYPPVGAIADSLGGLPAARAVSLLLMMGASAAVYFTGLRLFGRQAAFFGAALFAVTGLIVHYGAFATYDAPALFFLAVGLWAAVHVREGGYKWIAACAAALVISNACKYATLAWDPVVAGVVLLDNWERGLARAFVRSTCLMTGVAVAEAALLWLGGSSYRQGLIDTTLIRTLRTGAAVHPSVVMQRAIALTAVMLVSAFAGVVVSIVARDSIPRASMLVLFILAGLFAPLDQARIHELTSLDKNMGFGLIFPVLAAGYAAQVAARHVVRRIPGWRIWCNAAAAAVVLLALVLGRVQHVQFRGLNIRVADQIVSAMKKGYRPGTYIVVSGNIRVDQYYMPDVRTSAWMGVFTPDVTIRDRFRKRICAARVSLVVMRSVNGTYDHPFDYQLRSLLTDTQMYDLSLRAGDGSYVTQVWALKRIHRDVSGACAPSPSSFGKGSHPPVSGSQ